MFGDEVKVIARPYQEQMRDVALEFIFRLKHRGTLCVAPMGCGKSLTMALTADEAKKYGGVLILSHFKKLADQNRNAVRRLGHTCYIYTGGEKDVIWTDVRNNGAAVSATVQSMSRALHKIDKATFKLILIDEGHHAVLDSDYHKIAQYFEAPVILYSATPERADGKPLAGDGALCESVAYNGQIREFVREGWILEPRIRYEEVDSMDWTVIDNDSSPVTEEQAAKVWEANEAHFASVKPMLASVGDMPMLGFAPTVKLAKLWAEMVNDDRPGCAEYVASFKPGDYTSAKMDFAMTERTLIESQYESGQLQYLFNQGVYLEGADLVRARCAVMYILTSSKSKYVQAVGRVLRPANDENGRSILIGYERATAAQRLAVIAASNKPNAVVIDYAGSSGPNKLVHPTCLLADKKTDPKVIERVEEVIKERLARGERDVSLEEVLHDQEEAYRKFLVRDAKLRRSIAVEFETSVTDIDPWGSPEVTSGQRYQPKKINPPPPKVVEQIAKYRQQLGERPYSKDFYDTLNNGAAFAILKKLREKINAQRSKQSCPQWVIDKLESLGEYGTPGNYAEGLKAMHRLEKAHARRDA